MAYIGRPLQVANLAVQSGTGDGSDTTPIATLDYATTTNGIAVYLDGVRQLAGTDFNVTAQTTLTFTTAPANGVGIDVYFLGLELSIPTPADGTVTTAKIAANAVDETKLKDALVADFTEVTVTASDSILLGDATDSGNTKRDTVQGILDLVPVNGWEFVSSAVASASTSLSFTNMVSGYDYEYVLDTIISASDGVGFEAEVGVSGPTYRTSNYEGQVQGINDSGVSQSGEYQDRFEICDGATEQLGTGTNEVLANGSFFLNNPAGTSNMTSFRSLSFLRGSNVEEVMQIAGGLQTAVEAHTCVKFACSSGNIASGNIFQYRRKRS